jgi:hypothetical protein
MKFYVAGLASKIPDWSTDPGVQELLRPDSIPSSQWTQLQYAGKLISANQSRLMLLSMDASTGATYVDDQGVTLAHKFTQVYHKTETQNTVKLVTDRISGITCFGFSSNATAVGGYSNVKDGTTVAIVLWRPVLKPGANELTSRWNELELGPGKVTAMKYVGFAWYIATYDPVAEQSSMYFTSINFNAASLLDAWNVSTNALYAVTSIDAAVPNPSACADGYEKSPVNPLVCIRKCPTGYHSFGLYCVQNCPLPYVETSQPNECKPDYRIAKVLSPSAEGQTPVSLAPKTGPEVGQNPSSIDYKSLITVTVITSIVFLLFVGMFFHGVKKNK